MPRGAITKRSARPGGGSGSGPFAGGVASAFLAQVADTNTVSAVFVDLLVLPFTLSTASTCQFWGEYAFTLVGSTAILELTIDAVHVTGSASGFGQVENVAGALLWQAALGAGAHTVRVRWKVNGGAGQAFCRAATDERESAGILVTAA